MHYNEADTRAKLVDPAIYKRGWTEDLIKREQSAPEIIIVGNVARRHGKGRTDYTLRVKANPDAHPVAVAVLEAKASHLPPDNGLEQAKQYATAKRLNVPFVFASNGFLFVEYDRFTGITTTPRPLCEFPTPDELRTRYEIGHGFALGDAAAKPLLLPYAGGESARRYYQDAAIRAVLERMASGGKRALLSLATGAGKTRIAVLLAKRLYDAGLLRKCLFVCDRDELRTQSLAAFQNIFGADAQPVESANAQTNARVLIATYQTLDIDTDDASANFLAKNYPPNYFSHIIIDECHRSAWGKWSQVLTQNPEAFQVGLTATPRSLKTVGDADAATKDEAITADNRKHFGEPVYDYEMAQGMEDGYLARCGIVTVDTFIDRKTGSEKATGITQADLQDKTLTDANTGETKTLAETRAAYGAGSFERRLVLPERVKAMCADFFARLVENDAAPEQKTILFCASDRHCDAVVREMNNAYASYCQQKGIAPKDYFAFKCTSAGGKDYLSDLRGSRSSHFGAATVDLLSTGVDIPALENVGFFKYVESAISFYQMVGRGTRLDIPTGKLMFTVYDYTNATRLFGQEFATMAAKDTEPDTGDGATPDETAPETIIEAHGFHVKVTEAGRFVLVQDGDKAMPMPAEEYRQRVAAQLLAAAPTLTDFRNQWISPQSRAILLAALDGANVSGELLRALDDKADYDLFDVLGETGYGMAGRTRQARATAFETAHGDWLGAQTANAATVYRAMVREFAKGGTDALENPMLFQLPEIRRAGGVAVLKPAPGEPNPIHGIKERIFTV